ncbi:arsenate reductase (azurin) large subunit [Halorubrum sp. BOL3-1]|uniref:arsenate reductase (azurin) large subunit n=1 Tax=Halorubrum sp. BOL3-1 TaxID=2497325 RepID=UPI0010050E8C|nr:arsenate reductase (azurin) large subunit [Halorubrum sp. BOL3-1]QAU14252.1 arsenate reductase (azurin) large subunit [Halorubrum sp. BOL3-1]
MTGNNPNSSEVPIPPTDAERSTRSCRYCIVGCGYEVYKWPVGEEGGPTADENALGVDYPAGYGEWPSPNMHEIIEEDGQEYHIIFKPDTEYPVNEDGAHSIRGGTQAESLYTPNNEDYDDRLKHPQIRIGGELTPVDWDTAIEAWARATEIATENGDDPNGYGQKLYFYQFVENTFAGTKLCYDVIGSPNWGGHNRPALTTEVPGIVNAGLAQWSYAYEDAEKADTMVLAGCNVKENQNIIFSNYITSGGAALVVIDPRRTFLANYAENNGGVHLQLNEATDPILLNAIARHIVDQGWHAEGFIEEWVMDDRATIDEEGWYQEELGTTPEEYYDLLDDERYAPENAAETTGVPAAEIREAAELIAQPDDEETNTLFMLEKGLIWGWSHENTGAMANLTLLTGSVGRPGTGITRGGGHQEGFWTNGSEGDAIAERSTQTFDGERVEDVTLPPNATERVKNGEVSHWHVIGNDPARHSYSTQDLRNTLRERTSGAQPQSADIDEIERAFRERIENGGLVITHQELYPNTTTQYADIVLPARAVESGEGGDYHRWNGERRLRQYEGFMEGPSNAKEDWEIFAMMGQRLGADDMDWEDSRDIFNEICEEYPGTGGDHSLEGIAPAAEANDMTPAEYMETVDDGVQQPIYEEDGEVQGTPRIHAPDGEREVMDHRFHTSTGEAIFQRVDWDRVVDTDEGLTIGDVYDRLSPGEDELWVTNGRLEQLWQNMYTHERLEYINKRFPQNIIQLHPNDAAEHDIEAGDLVEVTNDDVFHLNGENEDGSFTAVAYVLDPEEAVQGMPVQEGLAFTYWMYPGQASNDINPAYLDPANPNPGYKYGKGTLRRLGESGIKDEMSFKPMNVAPE